MGSAMNFDYLADASTTWLPEIPLQFTHESLNPKKESIRILRVLPALEHGLIQCEIANESIGASYSSLSYVWGEDTAAYQILLNGRLFQVRRNLLEFLDLARRSYPMREFWIDAICIDQNNTSERNHQVTQMGTIYSNAEEVIVWLGASKVIAEFFNAWLVYSSATRNAHVGSKNSWEFKSGYLSLINHAYWRRAWVTQELALAKKLKIRADGTELDAVNLKGIAEASICPQLVVDERFKMHTDMACGTRKLNGVPLMTLLNNLPHRQCGIGRDQVYSLLSLAAEGSRVSVDYDLDYSAFIFSLAEACTRSMCICTFGLLSDILQLSETIPDPRLSEIIHYACVDLHPSPIAQENDTSTQKCTTCQTQLHWKSKHGLIFCLRNICPSSSGHIRLRHSQKKSTTIMYWADNQLHSAFRAYGPDEKFLTIHSPTATPSLHTLHLPIHLLAYRKPLATPTKHTADERRSTTLCEQATEHRANMRFICKKDFLSFVHLKGDMDVSTTQVMLSKKLRPEKGGENQGGVPLRDDRFWEEWMRTLT